MTRTAGAPADGVPGGGGCSEPVAEHAPAWPADEARAWPQVAVDPVFGRYLAGSVLTMLGIWVFNIVAVVAAYDATGSAVVAGAVTAGQFVPHIVLTLLAGALADRWSRTAQAAVGHGLAACGSGGLAVWAWSTDLAGDAAGPLIAASVVVGIGTAVAAPAVLSLVPSLVRPAELPTAVTLGMAPLPLGRALGPVLGTTLAVAVHPAAAFALTAAMSLTFVVLVRGLRPRRTAAPGDDGVARAGMWQHLRAHRSQVVLLVCVAAAGAGTDPPLTLAPAISADLVGTTSLAGTVATAFGVGAGVGFALIPLARRALGVHRHGYAGLLVMALGSVVSTAPSVVPAVAGFAVAGAGLTLTMTGLSTALQSALPDRLRGRLMALWSLAFVGTRPVAALVNGLVADHVGPAAALLGMAAVAAAAGCLGLARGTGARTG